MNKLIEMLRRSRAAEVPQKLPPAGAWSQLQERLVAEGVSAHPINSRWKKALVCVVVLVILGFLFMFGDLRDSLKEDDSFIKHAITDIKDQSLVFDALRDTNISLSDSLKHTEMIAMENVKERPITKGTVKKITKVLHLLGATKTRGGLSISQSEQVSGKPKSRLPIAPKLDDSDWSISAVPDNNAVTALPSKKIPDLRKEFSLKLPTVTNVNPAKPKRPEVPTRWEIITSGALIDNGGSSNLSSNFSGRHGAFQLGDGPSGANGAFVTDEGEELYWVGASRGRTATPVKFNSFYFRGGLNYQTSWGIGVRAYLGYYRFSNLGQKIDLATFNDPFGGDPDLFTKQFSTEQKVILGSEISYIFLRRRRVQPYLALGIAAQVYDFWQTKNSFTVPATGQRGLVNRQRIVKWWESEPSFSATGGVNYRLSHRWSIGAFMHTINLFENVKVPPVGLEVRYLLD